MRLHQSYSLIPSICIFVLTAFALTACQSGSDSKSSSSMDVGSVSSSATNANLAAIENKSQAYSAVYANDQGAIASVNPLATQAGLDAFARGGNAIDAALAVAFTLGVVDSHNSGIGGGCFILARLQSGEILAIDGREMAPQKAHRDMYIIDGQLQEQASKTGALAPGIPGSVAALQFLQQKGGKLQFSDVLLPAADLADKGFAVDQTLALRLARTADAIKQFPATAAIFLPQGQALKQGETLRQKDLASSYRQLAQKGADWFYRGEFAKNTGQWMAANGGIISAEDFAAYHTVLREPVRSSFKGYEVVGFPPPSSGGVHVAQMLNILSAYDLKAMSEGDYFHVLAETMRLAFADRAFWLGDSDFVPVPKNLISSDYAAQLRKKIDLSKAAEAVEHGLPHNADTELFDKHTTHLATADRYGNWVAITTTVNTSFGSKVVIPGTGVLLNNQMDDFSIQPGVPNAFGLVGAEANSIAPGKRPLSSMSPTLVMKDGQPVMSIGAAGGPTIISQVLQGLVRKLGLQQSLEQAIGGLRIHHQWRPKQVFIEPSMSADLRKALEAKGHKLYEMGSFGGTQAIAYDGQHFSPITEPRIIKRNQEAQ